MDLRAVIQLYAAANSWPERTPEQVAHVLDVFPAVGAWDGDRLIGFARAITDSEFRAYIEDVTVDPGFRHQGVATAVLRELLALL
ncbi:MAG: GNAT family N-acetyltransferase, partial [Chloroflexota bacterium]